MGKKEDTRKSDKALKLANVPTLTPNQELMRLRDDLRNHPELRKELMQSPSLVFDRYGLNVVIPDGTLKRLSTGGGVTLPPGDAGVHADAHADAHLDVDPHIDMPMHLDLF
jgi:hypothetical protein